MRGGWPSRLVISDLDGTLLDRETYRFDAAWPALARLATAHVPLILCSSKTRAELLVIRSALEHRHPFIVENGGALVIPRGYFPFDIPGAAPLSGDEGCDVLPLGTPHRQLVAALASASCETGVDVRPFSSLDARGVSEHTGLSLEEAARALMREWDEPFDVLTPGGAAALRAAIAARGLSCEAGGRFHHIRGANDKGAAARRLVALYRRMTPRLSLLALGDAPNDAPLLAAADHPVIVNGPHALALRALVPHAAVTRAEGPAGWNEAVSAWIDERDPRPNAE